MKIIDRWKKYLDNKQKRFIFFSFLFVLPSPMYLFIISGLLPPILLIIAFPFIVVLSYKSDLDLVGIIFALAILLIHFCISLYINKVPTNLVFKMTENIKDGSVRWKVLILIVLLVLFLSVILNFYIIGDMGGGIHRFGLSPSSE